MFNYSNISISHAKTALILGHTTSGMGEKTLALKFRRALDRAGYPTKPIIDLFELLGDDYEVLARLNYELAEAGFSIMDDLRSQVELPQSDILIVLSWSFSLAALYATGLHKTRFTAAKIFAHHPNEKIITQLYDPLDLLLSESLLAHERAIAYGIDPAKLLYLPHTYPVECETIKQERTYIERLAKNQGKSVDARAKVIGCVGRLEYGKNFEFALEAARRLREEKENIVLVLKGDFPTSSPYPEYKPRFSEMLRAYEGEHWFLWDRETTPFPDVLDAYSSFDVLLHPSGAEGASHVVIECLGLKKPVVLLDCSTNPYLFTDLATFVKTTGEIREAQLPFYIPDLNDLCLKLKRELKAPDPQKVQERFSERILMERLPLLFEPNPQKIKELYQHDRRCYAF